MDSYINIVVSNENKEFKNRSAATYGVRSIQPTTNRQFETIQENSQIKKENRLLKNN